MTPRPIFHACSAPATFLARITYPAWSGSSCPSQPFGQLLPSPPMPGAPRCLSRPKRVPSTAAPSRGPPRGHNGPRAAPHPPHQPAQPPAAAAAILPQGGGRSPRAARPSARLPGLSPVPRRALTSSASPAPVPAPAGRALPPAACHLPPWRRPPRHRCAPGDSRPEGTARRGPAAARPKEGWRRSWPRPGHPSLRRRRGSQGNRHGGDEGRAGTAGW